MRGNQASKSYGHAAVIVCTAVRNMPGRAFGDAHKRIIRRSLRIVAVRGALRGAVEKMSGDDIRTTTPNRGGDGLDPWSPSRIVGPCSRVNFDVVRKICEEYLAGWEEQHVSVVGAISGCIGCPRFLD